MNTKLKICIRKKIKVCKEMYAIYKREDDVDRMAGLAGCMLHDLILYNVRPNFAI